MAAAPDSCAMCAISTALICSSSNPFRILTVTGFWMARTVFSMISPAKSGFFIRAEPSPLFTILGTGHPMLMSKISNGSSSIRFACSLMMSGSEPNNCRDTGLSRSSIVRRNFVFLLLYIIPFALTISMQSSPAPCSLQSRRNGRSVTPAIGPKIRSFSNFTFPICNSGIFMLSQFLYFFTKFCYFRFCFS